MIIITVSVIDFQMNSAFPFIPDVQLLLLFFKISYSLLKAETIWGIDIIKIFLKETSFYNLITLL